MISDNMNAGAEAVNHDMAPPNIPDAVLSSEEKQGRIMSAIEEIHTLLSGIVAAVPALGGARYSLDRLRAHIASLRAE